MRLHDNDGAWWLPQSGVREGWDRMGDVVRIDPAMDLTDEQAVTMVRGLTARHREAWEGVTYSVRRVRDSPYEDPLNTGVMVVIHGWRRREGRVWGDALRAARLAHLGGVSDAAP